MQIDLTPDPSLLAIMAIFLLNYLVVRQFFLKPVNHLLEERETEKRTAAELYEQSLARFDEATSNMEAQVHQAKREAAQVRDRFRSEAGAHRGTVIEQTQGQARQLVGEAEKTLSQDVVEARQKIKHDSEKLARLAAEKILGRPV
jgi:F0F1-type ATP synthase membrane subunit b/b'